MQGTKEKPPLTTDQRRAIADIGETIWPTTELKLPDGREGENAKKLIRADKRDILYRTYWRCPACHNRVSFTNVVCDKCNTPKPASTLLDDKVQIERLVRQCLRRLKRHYKEYPVGSLGDLSIRELFMVCGVVLNEIYAAKEKGLLG